MRVPGSTERITNAAHGVDQLDIERLIEFRAQAFDGDVDHVGIAVEVHVPHFRCNQGPRQRFALPFAEEVEQREFLVRERDVHALARHASAQDIDVKIRDLEYIRLAYYAASQQSSDAQHEFGERERLDEIVVRAQFQAVNTIPDVIARGQEYDWQVAFRAQRLHDLPAVQAGQHDIEHDQLVRMRQRLMQTIGAVADQVDLIPGLGEPLLQIVAGLAVVFYNQDGHAAGASLCVRNKAHSIHLSRRAEKMTKKSLTCHAL